MSFHYLPRAIEKRILSAARHFPVIVLTGPRQSGKSTLLSRLFKDYAYVSLDDPARTSMAKKDPRLFLEDLGPRVLIDEIQYAPELLPYIKIAADKSRQKPGMFILTGSQIFPLMAGLSESLAGRAALFELLGFSWEELPPFDSGTGELFRRLFKGFYPKPAAHGAPPQDYYSSYLRTYLERDIRQIKAVHDLSLFQSFLELLAARAGSILNLSEVAKDCGVSQPNARHWLSLLESTRIVYLLRPYFRNLSKRVVKRPKIYFTDTGLLAHLLKYQDAKTLSAGPMAGAFFENMAVIELLKQKFNHGRPYELYFLRDSNGNEADAILDWGARIDVLEFKLSRTLRPDLAKPLERLGTPLKNWEGYVLSQADEEVSLSSKIKARPWWRLREISRGRAG